MNKKILWIMHFVPFPPKGGAFQRSFNLLRKVAETNDVVLVAVRHKTTSHPQDESRNAKKVFEGFCKEVHIIEPDWSKGGGSLGIQAVAALFSPHSLTTDLYNLKEVHQLIDGLLERSKFDIALMDSISVAQYVDRFRNAGIKTILNHHGAEGCMMMRRVSKENNYLKKVYYYFEACKLRRDERIYCPQFDLNVAVCDLDIEIMKSEGVEGKFRVVENGVDVEYFLKQEPKSENRSLIFAGRLDQYSNREGILWFCRSVWPALKAEYKDLTLTIIGNNPPEELRVIGENTEGIIVAGYVDDVRTYFAESSVGVVPLRDGGGTRIKILDALSMGMPVVATDVAIEGLEVKPEQDLLVANDAKEFVRQVGRLLNKEMAEKYSIQGRRLVETIYSWNIIGGKLDSIMDDLLGTQGIESRGST